MGRNVIKADMGIIKIGIPALVAFLFAMMI